MARICPRIWGIIETVLEVEMDEHPGYEKHVVEGRNLGNSRNGTRSTTVLESGSSELRGCE